MNVVYALINTSKTSVPYVYIGSKSDCSLVKENGVSYLVGSNGKKYIRSSCNELMKREIREGHVFSVEILECCNRKELRDREQEWLEEMNASENCMFYNLINTTVKCEGVDPLSIVNDAGESYKKVASSRSAQGRRDATAKSLGFEDSYSFLKYVCHRLDSGETSSKISSDLRKQRHFAKVTTRKINIPKFLSEDPSVFIESCAELWFKNYSYELIAEQLDIEVPTAVKAVSLAPKNRFMIARRVGRSVKELDESIALLVLKGKNFQEISKELNLHTRTVQKYFIRFFRQRFKISDLG